MAFYEAFYMVLKILKYKKILFLDYILLKNCLSLSTWSVKIPIRSNKRLKS